MSIVLILEASNFLSINDLLQKFKVLGTILLRQKIIVRFKILKSIFTIVDYNVINKVINDVTSFSFLRIYSIT